MPPKKTAVTAATAATKLAKRKKAAEDVVQDEPKVASKRKKAADGVKKEAPRTAPKTKKATVTAKALARTSTLAQSKAVTNGTKRAAKHEDEEPTLNGIKRRKISHDTKGPPPSSNQAPIKQAVRPTLIAKTVKIAKPKAVLNHAPAKRLELYVCGANSGGELGLGADRAPKQVLRPRLNPNLRAGYVGVVQVATGGMHCAALTHDNKILTWGVNDMGALGRDTKWDGGLVDMDVNGADSDSDDSDAALNPREAMPTAIDESDFPKGTIFTQLVAGDNATFALTDDGLVYGWGTFRGNDGESSFSPGVEFQRRPARISSLQKITKLAAGNNHVLALTSTGAVLAWGSGEQFQLGRRTIERMKRHSRTPREMGLRKNIVDIGAGANHSFAVHKDGTIYSWGLNNYGQTGVMQSAGENDAAVLHPTVVESLKGHGQVTCIAGGNHHSIAVTDQGAALVWGRLDGYTAGMDIKSLPTEKVIRDEMGRARILTVATRVPGLDVAFAAAGSEHCLAVTRDGKAYSWGFSSDYRTGLGTEDDVECVTLIENAAVRGKKLVWAGAGGQYSILASEPTDDEMAA